MSDKAPLKQPEPYDALGEAKRLLRTIRSGGLATLGEGGDPFCSLVSAATLPDGSPLLLLSRLAAHTGHLETDPRCSLLLAQTGRGDPLAHPRLSVSGRAEPIGPDGRVHARARFLSRHPKAVLYIDFADFTFWRLDVAAAHLNGGFARAARFDGRTILTDTRQHAALMEAEQGAIDHMNADHRGALQLYGAVLGRAGEGDWRASGIDPEGIDLLCGDRTARISFDAAVRSPAELRMALKSLAEQARVEQRNTNGSK